LELTTKGGTLVFQLKLSFVTLVVLTLINNLIMNKDVFKHNPGIPCLFIRV